MNKTEQDLLLLVAKYESALWRLGIDPQMMLDFTKDETQFPLYTSDDYYEVNHITEDADEYFSDEQFETQEAAQEWLKRPDTPKGSWVIEHIWELDGTISVPVAEVQVR